MSYSIIRPLIEETYAQETPENKESIGFSVFFSPIRSEDILTEFRRHAPITRDKAERILNDLRLSRYGTYPEHRLGGNPAL